MPQGSPNPAEIRIAAAYGGPGPAYMLPPTIGANGHDPTRVKNPGYSFGQKFAPNTDCSPGPIYHVNPSLTRRGGNGNPRYSFAGRQKELSKFHTPGPGAYNCDKVKPVKERKAPAYSIGLRTRYRPTDNIPAPNSYSVPSTLGSKVPDKRGNPSFTMTARNANSYDTKTPGPNHYKIVDASVYKKRPVHFSLKGRTSQPGDKTQKPGPGAHNPQLVTVHMKSNPKFTMGTRHSQFVMPMITLADVSD
ncbi:outer dense fiber protein 3 [Lingula anatina]|uniref:Outer dense fiber protein 3 n=1 Tax=Lingula anatina TaxID=7574 RepID=A0A1S3HYH0_LINAN|nr:outer dense fiber protein 3 [Lingula anatina]|eukprot:XP_013390616.1 outer dense fiber protein 3 [Lingula anatina]